MASDRAVAKRFPLVATMARALFVAEMGHTGMTWEQLDDEFGKGEYERTVGRLLEQWQDTERPFVVLDLNEDEMWLQATAGDEL